ncbi:MAG: methyltransferase domain-containing protein [Ignavibacteriae bacterium]|nr:methyltransferase domain-containing protein [Ignavibacteriota bacterium]
MRNEWMNPDNLSFSSEADQVLFYRHKKAYNRVVELVKNKEVLELGCGSGFGTNILSKYVKSLSAVDRDKKALDRAKANNEGVDFYDADIIIDGLPFENDRFDAVIAFQVFEHIHPDNSLKFLDEISRVLKKGGIFYLTTPNRKTRLYPFQKPTNKYHMIEYTANTLSDVLSKVYSKVDLTGLRAQLEIEKIERKRAKGTAFNAYIRNPFRKSVIKIFGSVPIKKNSTNNTDSKTKVQENEFIKKITEDDFHFSNDDLNKSIDFFAACTK